MATFVQAITGFNSAGSNANLFTSAFAGTTVSGNSIIVGVCINSSTNGVASITDTQANKYTLLASQLVNSMGVYIYIATNITGGAANSVQVTESAGTDGEIFAQEWSGMAPVFNIDGSKSDSGTSAATTTSSTITTALSNDVIFSVLMLQSQTNSYSLGSGYTNLSTVASNFSSGAMESKATTAPTATTASFGMTNTTTLYNLVTLGLRTTGSLTRPAFRSNLRPHPFSPGLAR